MEYLAGASRAFRIASFIHQRVNEGKLKKRLRAHGYNEIDTDLVLASLEFLNFNEKDKSKIYKKHYMDSFKIPQDRLEQLFELDIVGALQYEDVGELIIGNSAKALEAKNLAKTIISDMGLPSGKPITQHDIILLAYKLRQEKK